MQSLYKAGDNKQLRRVGEAQGNNIGQHDKAAASANRQPKHCQGVCRHHAHRRDPRRDLKVDDEMALQMFRRGPSGTAWETKVFFENKWAVESGVMGQLEVSIDSTITIDS